MDKKEFLDLLKERVLIMDGATGTELDKKHYFDDIITAEELNIKFPERISDIYSSYINAGSDIILANTFGANPARLSRYKLENKTEEIIKAGIELIRKCAGAKKIIAAGDISSIGDYVEPLGGLSFDTAYEAFSVQASLMQKYGADIIVIETITEIKELKAALLAAKDNFKGAIIVQMTFTKDGFTVTGTDIKSFIAMVESLGADAIGLNCSVGASDLADLAKVLSENTNLPISFKPNAGMPILINKKTVFPGTIDDFVKSSLRAYSYGVNMFGGCCGTSPEYINALAKELKNKKPIIRKSVNKFFLSSRVSGIDINSIKRPVIIGERINPTNRKNLQNELLKGKFSLVKDEARMQESAGAALLDVNMGVPSVDEIKLLSSAVNQIQEIVKIPLCIDSSNSKAIEDAVKNCAGRVLINSVNGEISKLETVMPIAKRYGCALIALTTDDSGIPKTADARLKIAEKILDYANKFGIEAKNIIFDYLVLAVSASPEQTIETLNAIRQSKKLYPECKTVLGLSNISFGLPQRQIINSTFMKMAVDAGLDFAIANPHEKWDIFDEYAKNLLENKDKGAVKYMEVYGYFKKPVKPAGETEKVPLDKQIYEAVLYGNKESVDDIINEIIACEPDPFKTVNDNVLKALNLVGDKFSAKEYFLPQIIMSAEAAQKAFANIKKTLKRSDDEGAGKVIMATVKGDMHDIGKNIVCAVLESYGFEVVDMGVNVEAKAIIEKAIEIKPVAAGLSALMTTTMPEMEAIIKLRDENNLKVPILIGGAAVTQKFADEIGADFYVKDAVEAAKIVQRLKK
ncbi:MAG: homocysteine S-methyltransferase family protein [Elusimicrobiota bacterium]|jgi:5-methyltetrahydrofolate--homocysteine methyltransferase|nr:homocysteine S-methyltransferase family protein [Elusimicrobiota bacterium]